jgi:hypothetical protein
MEVSGQLHALAALPPRESAIGSHWIGGSLIKANKLKATDISRGRHVVFFLFQTLIKEH